MIVVDTSAVIARLAGAPVISALRQRLDDDADWHAPHLLDVEFTSALWRLVRAEELGRDRAADARTDFVELTIARYPHEGLSERVWALRDNVRISDGYFVALAEFLNVPLVTLDARLSRTPGHAARIELFGE